MTSRVVTKKINLPGTSSDYAYTLYTMASVHDDFKVTLDGTADEVEKTAQDTTMSRFRALSPDHAREVEKRVLRKVDMRLLPLIVILYMFNYLDRNSITQARLYGLQEDTNVKGATYQSAISIFPPATSSCSFRPLF